VFWIREISTGFASRRVARAPPTDHAIDTFAHEVDEAIAATHHQFDTRIARTKRVDVRQHDACGVRAMQVQPQHATRVAGLMRGRRLASSTSLRMRTQRS
jgi:hypothetical protein